MLQGTRFKEHPIGVKGGDVSRLANQSDGSVGVHAHTQSGVRIRLTDLIEPDQLAI